jgi:excisionase family DNA binding protein
VLPALLTVEQVAEVFQVTPATVRNWAREGVIKSLKTPGTKGIRFRRTDIEELLSGTAP